MELDTLSDWKSYIRAWKQYDSHYLDSFAYESGVLQTTLMNDSESLGTAVVVK